MSVPEPPQVTWMLTSDAWPTARWPRGPDFTAFDGDLLVGRVFQHQDGPDESVMRTMEKRHEDHGSEWLLTAPTRRAVFVQLTRPEVRERSSMEAALLTSCRYRMGRDRSACSAPGL